VGVELVPQWHKLSGQIGHAKNTATPFRGPLRYDDALARGYEGGSDLRLALLALPL